MRKAAKLSLVALILGAIGASAAQLTTKTYTGGNCAGLSCTPLDESCNHTTGCACLGGTGGNGVCEYIGHVP
jgi:hypothetical protein